MPHSLFLGSALATQDRLSPTPPKDDKSSLSSLGSLPEERRPTGILNRIKSSLAGAFRINALDDHGNRPQRHEDRENNSYWFVESHVYHGVVDIVLSLLGVAVVINSMWVTMTIFKLVDGCSWKFTQDSYCGKRCVLLWSGEVPFRFPESRKLV